MSDLDRAALRRALIDAEPWLNATDLGPRAVDAGPCDRCGEAPRVLPVCGPTAYAALCPNCAEVVGDDGWCDGHLEQGRAARAWARDLPDRWADAAVLWWVATGEVRMAPTTLPDLAAWPASIRALVDRD